jgi:hypothetical protein
MNKPFPVHPFLFAIFPIIFLFSFNLSIMSAHEIFVPIAITIFFTSVLWSLLGLVLRDLKRAALITTLFLLLFFSYGHFQVLISGLTIGGVEIGRDKYLLPSWGILLILCIYLSLRIRGNLNNLTKFLNLIVILMISIRVTAVGYTLVPQDNGAQDMVKIESPFDMAAVKKQNKLPDIYYIVLDGYARADVLKEIYGYDNGEFIDYLGHKGFYVATRSRSNYGQTLTSLTSTLNGVYLHDFARQVGIDSSNRWVLKRVGLDNNGVVRFLKEMGYVFVAFSSGYNFTELPNADIYISSRWSLSEFQNILVSTTPLAILLFDLHRGRTLHIFDHLADMAGKDFPVFVFSHIPCPHPPFVFGENGQRVVLYGKFNFSDGNHFFNLYKVNREFYIKNYRRQIAYVNKKLKETIDRILSKSAVTPIIILQSDHGPGSGLNHEDPYNTDLKERFSILNAYYLPSNGRENLYDDITPINTFKLIFNHYFGSDIELWEDESYYATWSHPYQYTKITDEIK